MNTNVLPLLSRLKQLDITLELVEDNLKIHAPEGKLAPALISEIKDKKKEIIAFMQQAQKQVKYTSVLPVEKKEYYPPSSAQRRLYILQQMEPDNTTYNMPEVLLLEEEIDKEQLENTFKKLITRHESLRTSFAMPGETPIQKVCPPGKLEFGIEYYDLEEVKVKAEDEEKEGTRGLAPSPGEPAARTPQPAAALINSFIRPFDLSQAPLLRVGVIVIRGESSHQLLLIDMHHIVTDGVSQELLKREFTLLHTGNPLLPLKVYYKDYSEWLNRPAVKKVLRQQGEFWLKEYGTDIPILNLPTDFARPLAQSYEGSSIKFELSPGESGALLEMARSANTTIFILLMAIYYIFLSKLSGQEDIVVGTPTAGRRHPDLQQIIGIFINTLALRGCPAGNKPFTAFLGEVKEKILTALENQDYPFEDLVEAAAVERDMSRNPLFDVMFALEGALTHPEHTPDSPGEHSPIKPYDYENKTAKFDLTLYALETRDQLVFTFEYCTRLFKPETITIFIAYFQKIISEIIQNPQQQISGIQIISRQEREKILYGFNDTDAEFPREKTIQQLFAQQAGLTPDHIALLGFEGTRGLAPLPKPVSITYRELNEKTDQLAYLLQAKGVKPDTIVGIMVERSIEMIIGIFAIVKAGGAYLPIDPDYPEERIKYMIADSNTKFLVTTTGLSEKFNKLLIVNCQLLIVNEIAPNLRRLNNPPKEANPVNNYQLTIDNLQLECTNLAYIIYTSGTTGKPKGAGLTHRNVVRLMKNDGFQFDFNHRDAWTMFHRYCFDFSVWEMYGALLYGGKLIVIPKEVTEDLAEYLKILKNQQITVLNQTPTAFYNLANIEAQQPDRHLNIRYIIFGGEALNPVNLKKWKQKYPDTKLINMYGITETTVHVTYKEITDREIQFNTSNIGKPIPTLSTYIMDNHLNLLPIGIPGELCVGGEGVGKGYLNRVELTNEKFVQNPCKKEEILFRSGDLVKLTGNGDMEYLGRIDNQVKIRGFRIELGEIENQLQKHEEIKHAAVVVREKKEDKYLCAYIVANNQLSATDLRKYLSKQLPDYMIPSYFVSLEKFPLTPNGKIDRKALPEPEIAMGKNYTAPRDTTEKQLAHIWWEVLSTGDKKPGKVGIDDDFFELGGHSLKAITAIANIHKTFNVKIAVAELFKHPTVREMAGYIKSSVKTVDNYSAIEPAEKNDYYELSSAQKRLYLLQQIDMESTTYNLPLIVGLGNNIDKEKIDSIFRELTRRHEALRTSFELHHGIMIQKIHPEVTLKINYDDASTRKNDNNPDKDKMAHFNIEERLKDFIKPFDLSKPPLMRVSLTKWAEANYLLMVDMHHIISDGISLNVLKNEFIALTREETLPALKIQYKDFSQWQNQRLNSEEMKKQETFWLNTFKLPPPTLDIPLDFNRPGFRSSQGNTLRFEVNEELTAKTRKLNKETGTTLFMALLTVYNILLHKYSGQADIVIGSPVSGRRHLDLEQVIGVFVNMISIRNLPAPGKSLANFLEEVKTNAIEAYDNQDYPFEELVRKLGLQGETSRNPVFDVGLVLQNIDDANILDAGAPRENTPLDQEAANRVSRFDMLFDVVELQNKLVIRLEYSTVLFRQSSIEKLAKHYLEILNQVAENREIKIKDITISTDLQSAASIDRGIEFEF